jgi:thiamine-phosphate pyrophosphorylase
MPFDLHSPARPLIYLITNGATTAQTTPATEDFASVLRLVRAAVAARIDLIQIREKNLSTRVLYQLAASAADLSRGSATRLLINDRSDLALAAGAAGVHLTTTSLPANVVRQAFGDRFLIGVSTHSLAEAQRAKDEGANFVVFGPIFETASKREYGPALGLDKLAQVSSELSPFAVLALGGVTTSNVADCIRAGARGIAGISMSEEPERLGDIADDLRRSFDTGQS